MYHPRRIDRGCSLDGRDGLGKRLTAQSALTSPRLRLPRGGRVTNYKANFDRKNVQKDATLIDKGGSKDNVLRHHVFLDEKLFRLLLIAAWICRV
jgi:hypothetical protein